jgi:lysophospholipid acyltransferase (LPLAT)-like uncharacterized protein
MLPDHPPRPLLAAGVAAGARCLGALVRLERAGGADLPHDGPAVLAGWHGEQLSLLLAYRHTGMRVMVSRSRDGQLATSALARLGVGAIRGSSSAGGAAALRDGIRHLRAGGRVAVLVDGPRGPRHEAAQGAAALAAMAGVPIVCMRAVPARALRLRSWDRFEIPLPLTRVRIRAAALPAPERAEIASATEDIRRTLDGLGGVEQR